MAATLNPRTSRPVNLFAGRKTAPGVFLRPKLIRTRKSRAQVAEPHQGKTPATTKPASGVRNHRYRYYSPGLGRWPTIDPIGFRGGLNLYAYVLNSPSNFFDRFGLECPVKSCEWTVTYNCVQDPSSGLTQCDASSGNTDSGTSSTRSDAHRDASAAAQCPSGCKVDLANTAVRCS